MIGTDFDSVNVGTLVSRCPQFPLMMALISSIFRAWYFMMAWSRGSTVLVKSSEPSWSLGPGLLVLPITCHVGVIPVNSDLNRLLVILPVDGVPRTKPARSPIKSLRFICALAWLLLQGGPVGFLLKPGHRVDSWAWGPFPFHRVPSDANCHGCTALWFGLRRLLFVLREAWSLVRL